MTTEVEGRKSSMTQSELLAYLAQKRKPGEKLDLTYLRDGESRKVLLDFP